MHFCCLNFAALAPATPPSSAGKTNHKHLCKFAFFHAWDCRVVTGWRVKVRSGLREARWIKGDCQLCCTRQMSGMPAMFFLPQTPFLTNLHSLPVSFLLSPSFWFMSACSCTHKSLDSEKSSCNASLRNLSCASSCLATQHRSDLNGGHKSGQLNMIT